MTDPATEATELRERLARALAGHAGSRAFLASGRVWDHHRAVWHDLADAILAARDTEMEQLRADCQKWADLAAAAERTRQLHKHDADRYEAELRARAETAEAERDQLLAELDGRDEEARERWIQKQLDETGLKSMDFRDGMSMDIEPARDMVAQWVGAARAMLGDAPNYSETPVEMTVKVGESPERFAFVLQRVGKLTPHQARQQAEARAERAEAAITRVRAVVADMHGITGARFWADALDTALDQETDR
ncbi:hypothetical protein [Streptomyces jumonjinensis]|uniref:DUF4337 domain-containing protein n=1 Tax=Streptomyces jumonjinensis TaxID=1945 RepID=A0A646KLG1_STRJU|nr:hypothetical protein [Streptomyces jumonjinensis]MQT03142.1 DUF4337 domain-containing protein [Streptomyces jumonjinensis]